MSGIPKWDDLTEEEKDRIKRGELIDIDGINYKLDISKLDCDVTVRRNDGTIEKY